MQELYLFIDASVNPQTKQGFGAYILTDDLKQDLKNKISYIMFEDTSSTKLELQSLLYVLKNIKKQSKLTIYTDSQNTISLLQRREKLEKNSFYTSTNKLLKNHELYKEFYLLLDSLHCEFIKVKGHKKSKEKDEIEKIFTLVDRASRKKLREYLS